LKQEREIIFYNSYFLDFYALQSVKVKDKIKFVFGIIKQVDRIPEKFLKHLAGTEGLYEVRIECERNIFRIFCCFDKGNLIVLFNGFQKKTQQTPKQEIQIAEKLKKEYFQQKKYEN
jgi:phage-related protein